MLDIFNTYMSIEQGCLILLGFLFILTSIFMVLTESSVHSILYLMFILLYVTELTIILKMEFLALIFIIVYIGAVCVLMLFHIKLIKTFVHRFDNLNNNYLFFPFLVVSIVLPIIQILTLALQIKDIEMVRPQNAKMLFSLDYNQSTNYISWLDLLELFTSSQVLGFLLYNIYFIYLILGSLVLLISMIGSIFLTLVKKKDKKFQNIDKQNYIDLGTQVRFYGIELEKKKNNKNK